MEAEAWYHDVARHIGSVLGVPTAVEGLGGNVVGIVARWPEHEVVVNDRLAGTLIEDPDEITGWGASAYTETDSSTDHFGGDAAATDDKSWDAAVTVAAKAHERGIGAGIVAR